MIKVRVKQHKDLGATGLVESVNLVLETADVVILHVSMHRKYQGVSAYGGATDEGCQSVWVHFDEIQIEGLPSSRSQTAGSE